MDGVVGIYSANDPDLADKVFSATGAVQHRGKPSAGIAITNDDGIFIRKGLGGFSEVIDDDQRRQWRSMKPRAAIGNVGYTKNTIPGKINAEPIEIHPKTDSRYQVVITMDGYLVSPEDLGVDLQDDYDLQTRIGCGCII